MVVIIIIMFAIILWDPIYCSMDHTEVPSSGKLDSFATIVNITQKKPSRKSHKIKTTIEFSDGFRFWAYDTSQRGLHLVVTPDMTRNMIERARKKHAEAMLKNKVK